jgi:segregation and condensation protein B
MSIKAKIETLLFVSSKPLTVRKLMQLAKEEYSAVSAALAELMEEYNGKRGMAILKNNDEYQMASAPEHAGLAQLFYKDELAGELTRPSLETLTIIAYRGPLTKPELEEIRGVNCSLILRNLLIRGLVQKEVDRALGLEVYSITMDFLQWLGVTSRQELPDYARLSQDFRRVSGEEGLLYVA